MHLPEFKLAGLKLPHKTINENGQSNIDCGSLWQRFETEEIADQIPDKLTNDVYAVYFDYEGDHTKPFSYFIGCKVDMDAVTPHGLDSLIIPKQQYQKVTAAGKMPDCISDSWKAIWKAEMDRAYGYDFELYDDRSKDWSKAEVDILVSTQG